MKKSHISKSSTKAIFINSTERKKKASMKRNSHDNWKCLETWVDKKAISLTKMMLTENIIKIIPVTMISSIPLLLISEFNPIIKYWPVIIIIYGCLSLIVATSVIIYNKSRRDVDLLDIKIQYIMHYLHSPTKEMHQ